MDTARAAFLGPGCGAATQTDRASAQRLGVTPGVSEVGHALIELGCWRTHIATMAPGPELVTALARRPDRLAPAPLTDPDQALRAAVTARSAELSQRVVTGWANAVLESVTARNRVLSWLQAEQYTDLAMLSCHYPGLAEMLPTEIAFALRSSESAAGSAISTARAFATRLPGTLHALQQGLIDVDHAVAVARATGTTTAQVAAQVENDVLPEVTNPGSSTTPEQLRRRAARRVIARDPDGAADRHRTAAKDRLMTRWGEDDGMAGLRVIAPAQQIAAIWEASTAMADARKTAGDQRPLGARRVDALTDVCTHILGGTIGIITNDNNPNPTPSTDTPSDDTISDTATGDATVAADDATAPTSEDTDTSTAPATDTTSNNDTAATPNGDSDAGPSTSTVPGTTTTDPARPAALLPIPLGSRHGRKPHIQVVVPYTVLLGSNDPCELIGHGTITADQARLIIADGTLQRLLCDPVSGLVLDHGRTRYQPPDTLKHFLIARDGTCRSPGCLQPADRCETDHVIPYRPGKPTGGSTNHDLLEIKCKHHHRAKDGGGFSNTRDPDGTSHWTTPLGRKYTRPPHSVWHPTNAEPGPAETHSDQPDPDEPDRADRFPTQPAAPATPTPGNSREGAEDPESMDDDPPPF
jgi:hypothetical protein